MKSELFKAHGWSVVVNPVSGSLYIYRPDLPGEILITRDEVGYGAEIYAHADKLVASTSATFEQLHCEE